MNRALVFVAMLGCGHGPGARPDSGGGDDDAATDASDANTIADAAIDAVPDAAIDARPGNAVTANGTCTYVDQPGWLSCPTGMSCQCYYHYWKLFENQSAHLDTWLDASSLEVTGGMIPQNQTLYGVTLATVPLTGMPKTGNVYPYQVTVAASGAVQIDVWATSGYVPPNFVKYSDADCGNEGKVLTCRFTNP